MITSLQNEKVKLIKGLQTRPRTRRKERKIVLEGTRLIRDALSCGLKPQFALYEAQTADFELVATLQARNVEVLPVNTEVMQYVSDTTTPPGVIGVFPLPTPPLPRSPQRILILDRLSDPGNLGTLLRTAAAAGVDVVVLSPESADPYNPKTLRSGMGAHFRVPLAEADWEQIAAYCENVGVYAATGDGDTSYDTIDWRGRWALIIGSEAHGVSAEARELATHQIFIPMAARTESLNAATAAAVVLFEAARQQRLKQ
ncbi:MAG: RNA methyltransferase [Anaerolineae bacterium]